MKRPHLTTVEYGWLIDLVDKNIRANRASDSAHAHPLFKLRIENMETLKTKLTGMREHELHRQTQTRGR